MYLVAARENVFAEWDFATQAFDDLEECKTKLAALTPPANLEIVIFELVRVA